MDDVTIWRYLDFTKFIDLVSSAMLWFCRSDRFDDPFEGSFPRKHVERRAEKLRRSSKDFDREIGMYAKIGERYRQYVYLNCWHMSDYESAALWRLYAKSEEAIAIRSTRHALAASVAGNEPGVWSVPVRYIDYSADDPPVPTRMAPFRYKRRSFEHERELRAIVYAQPEDEDGRILQPPGEFGIRIKTDLAVLIRGVHVAPMAPSWFYDLTVRMCKEFDLDTEVVWSSLSEEKPAFI